MSESNPSKEPLKPLNGKPPVRRNAGNPKMDRFILESLANGGNFLDAIKKAGYGLGNPSGRVKELLDSPYVKARFKSVLGTNPDFDRAWLLNKWHQVGESCEESIDPRDKAVMCKSLENIAKLLGANAPEEHSITSFEKLISFAEQRNKGLEAGKSLDEIEAPQVASTTHPPPMVKGPCPDNTQNISHNTASPTKSLKDKDPNPTEKNKIDSKNVDPGNVPGVKTGLGLQPQDEPDITYP